MNWTSNSSQIRRHPEDGDLLRFADGELPPRESRSVQEHLTSCWQCRAEMAEIERTVGVCVRYRESVLRPHLPTPPSSWMDIHGRMADLDQVLAGRPWYARLSSWLGASFQAYRPALAAAAVLALAAVAVTQLRNAPSVEATALLDRAVAARHANAGGRHAIEIRTAGNRVTRTTGATVEADAGALAAVAPLFARARYNWDDPLSANSFASWRNSLSQKRDEVMTVRDESAPGRKWYRVRTATQASILREATLQLDAGDLRPVEGSFHFAGSQIIEISDLGAVPAAVRAGISPVRPLNRSEVTAPASRQTIEPASPAEELRVLAVLRRLGADLGEPVEVRREGPRVVVSGLGVSPNMRDRIEQELQGVARVDLRLGDAPSAPVPAASHVVAASAPSPASVQWQGRIQQHLGGQAAFDEFTAEVLSASDALMARMHALRRLAERFPPATEAMLPAGDRKLLRAMVADHAAALDRLSSSVEGRSRGVFEGLGARSNSSAEHALLPAEWQAAAMEMFRGAQRTDTLLAAILGGAAANTPAGDLPPQVLNSVVELRARANRYLNALK